MPRPTPRHSTAAPSKFVAAGQAIGEKAFDTAFVVRMLDRLIADRLQDLDVLRSIALETNATEHDALHRQLLALARSARTAFDDLKQGREILVGLHKQASGGEVIASVDGRTSLPNKEALSAHLAEVLKRLQPAQTISLMLIEVGALKLLASEIGPAVANRFINRFAALLRRRVKRTDYAARISPQHFVVLFEDILPEKAVGIALRVHDAIETKMSAKRGPVAELLSVTMGIAATSGGRQTADELLQKAHDAVAQARTEGRPAIYVA